LVFRSRDISFFAEATCVGLDFFCMVGSDFRYMVDFNTSQFHKVIWQRTFHILEHL